MLTLGIDPGLSGGLALYNATTGALIVAKMPTHDKVTSHGTRKKVMDLHAIRNWLDVYTHPSVHAWIEETSSRPGQGVVSAFTFGLVSGILHMAVVMSGMRLTLVPPQVWKKAMRCTSDKDLSRQRASQLMPAYAHCWANKCQDGLAEAALLAYYGAHERKGL